MIGSVLTSLTVQVFGAQVLAKMENKFRYAVTITALTAGSLVFGAANEGSLNNRGLSAPAAENGGWQMRPANSAMQMPVYFHEAKGAVSADEPSAGAGSMMGPVYFSAASTGFGDDYLRDIQSWSEGSVTPVVGGSFADEISPEITALAAELQYDPSLIYNYVINNIKYEIYRGAKRGALFTLLERAGNDTDQCALLVALLRASGYAAGYEQWTWFVKVDNTPYGGGQLLDRLWGLSHQNYSNPNFTAPTLTNLPSDWTADEKRAYSYLAQMVANRGYGAPYFHADVKGALGLNVLVVRVPALGVYLIPWIKFTDSTSVPLSKDDIDFDPAVFLMQTGGLVQDSAIKQIDAAAIKQHLADNTGRAAAIVKTGHHSETADSFYGRRLLAERTSLDLPTSVYATKGAAGWLTTPTKAYHTVLAETEMAKLTIKIGTTAAYVIPVPKLRARRLAIKHRASTLSVCLDEEVLFTRSVTTATYNLALTIQHPLANYAAQTWTRVCRKNDNFIYVMPYQTGGSERMLSDRRAELDGRLEAAKIAYPGAFAAGEVDYSQITDIELRWSLMAEGLNVRGLAFQRDGLASVGIVNSLNGLDNVTSHFIGCVYQEESPGFDWGLLFQAPLVVDYQNYYPDLMRNDHLVAALWLSAIEHAAWEQSTGIKDTAISTIQTLGRAATSYSATSDELIYATGANWATAQFKFSGYSSAEIASIGAGLAANAQNWYLLPENRNYTLQSWSGHGYIGSKSVGGNIELVMAISKSGTGDITFGGQATTPVQAPPASSQYDGAFEDSTIEEPSVSNPDYAAESDTPAEIRNDPINFGTGEFLLDGVDLALGGAGVRGLSFARSYRSFRSNADSTGLGHGWIHNQHYKLSLRTSAATAMGSKTPAATATMTAASIMLSSVLREGVDVETLSKAVLLTKIATDELLQNAVIIDMGTDTHEFIRQADGSYTPPARSTYSLQRTGDVFYLMERHGDTYRFDLAQDGRLLDITDPFEKAKTFAYDGAGRLQLITDAYGRTLTFGYTPNADTIATVTDSTGRVVSFQYQNGNLTEVFDPENKKTTYSYQGHLITSIRDPLNRVTIENAYNTSNRIERQFNMGNPGRRYDYLISGRRSAERDPVGSVAVTYFDSVGRPERVINHMGETSRYKYDGQNRQLSFTTPRNEVTTYTYDSDHNLLTTQEPLGFQVINEYDSLSRLVKNTQRDADPLTPDRVSTISYAAGDTTNRPARTVAADGRATRFTYYVSGPAIGQLWKSIEETPLGDLTTEYIYDLRGLPAETIYADATSTSYVYNVRGDLVTSYDQRGTRTEYQYNLRRQATAITTAFGTAEAATAQTHYDDAGFVSENVDATGRRTHYTTSALGKVLTVTTAYGTPEATTTRNFYESRDLLENTIDPTSRQTRFEYDRASRRTAVMDGKSNAHRTIYDANGRPLQVSSPMGFAWNYQHNARGFRTLETDPLNKGIVHTPTSYGQPKTMKNRLGNTWTYDYDVMGRQTLLKSPANRSWISTYTNRGLLTTSKEPSNQTTTYDYFPVPRLKQKVDPVGTTDFVYDDAGNLTQVTEGASVISRTYDLRGRVSSYVNARNKAVGYTYDTAGRLSRLTYPGATFWVDHEYDGHGRLKQITDSQGRVTKYAYDAAGRLLSIKRPNGTTRTLRYDVLGRLDFIHEADAQGQLLFWRKYSYDADSRITGTQALPAFTPHTEQSPGATHDVENRLLTWGSLSIQHDADGNMTNGLAPSGTAAATYTYDARNRLTGIAGESYGYDAENNRIRHTGPGGTTHFDLDPHAGGLPRVLVRELPNGAITYYVYGLGLAYEVSPAAATERHYHGDHQCSTVVLTDAAGTTTDLIEYTAYGRITLRTGVTPTPFLYIGLLGVQTDANGLLHMRARYYHAGLMRFLNADPIGFAGGLNWYAYANGNPVSYVDPSGFGGVIAGNQASFSNRTTSIGQRILLNYAKQLMKMTDLAEQYPNSGFKDLLDQIPQADKDALMSGTAVSDKLGMLLEAASGHPAGKAWGATYPAEHIEDIARNWQNERNLNPNLDLAEQYFTMTVARLMPTANPWIGSTEILLMPTPRVQAPSNNPTTSDKP